MLPHELKNKLYKLLDDGDGFSLYLDEETEIGFTRIVAEDDPRIAWLVFHFRSGAVFFDKFEVDARGKALNIYNGCIPVGQIYCRKLRLRLFY